MDAFVGGAWKVPNRGEVLVSGAWRRLTRGEVYRNGAWRSIFTFVSPMTLTAYDVYGDNVSFRPTRVTSDQSTATPTGGFGPYSYSWVVSSGDATPSTPNLASTSFYQVVSPGQTAFSSATVTCTDALGNTASASITIVLTNNGGGNEPLL